MKKALSLFLVAVMLLTMIPLGAIGIFADDSVIEIGSAEDWNTKIVASETYAGKTIKLTSSFDAAAATLTTIKNFQGTLDGNGMTISNAKVTYGLLAQTSGTATIQDLTLSNVTANDGGNGHAAPLVCTAKNNLTVTNVTVENCAVSTTSTLRYGGLIANGYDGVQLNIANCNVDCTIAPATYLDDDDSNNSATNCLGAGLLIGVLYASGSSVTVKGCTFKGNIKGYTGTIGGIVGYMYQQTGNRTLDISDVDVDATLDGGEQAVVGGIVGQVYDGYEGQSITVENANVNVTANGKQVGFAVGFGDCNNGMDISLNNCTFDGTLTATEYAGTLGYWIGNDVGSTALVWTFSGLQILGTINANGSCYAGMLAGRLGSNGRVLTPTIDNCLFAGKIVAKSNAKVAVTFGTYFLSTGANASLDMNNCIFATEVTGITGNKALIGARYTYANLSTHYVKINLNNSLTTYEKGTYDFVDASLTGAVNNAKMELSVNGGTAVTLTNDNTETTDVNEGVATYAADSSLKQVKGLLDSGYAQVAKPDNDADTFAIRFVTWSLVDIDTAEMKIEFYDAAGTTLKKSLDTAKLDTKYGQVEAYDKLLAYSETGINEITVEELGAKKFYAVIIKDIPLGACVVKVTARYETANETVKSEEAVFEFNASGECTNTTGTILGGDNA